MSQGEAMCEFEKLVDGHFGSGLSLSKERHLRGHLPTCATCREYYERHQVLAQLDPQAATLSERLGRPLGFGPRSSARWPAPAMALATGAMALALFLRAEAPPPQLGLTAASGPDSKYVARGLETRSRVLAYRKDQGGRVSRLSKSMSRSDALAFAVENPEGFKYLMVFAVDQEDRVYWYHPAWLEPESNPEAHPLSVGHNVVELPEAIRHELRPGALEIHYLFTNERLSVREVERALLPKRHPGPIFPNARETIQRVRVAGEA